ncbi:tyrosinase family protein [Pricia sp. S334]|uniref:Tyrosinase family protein n=1 Tax=Pricia mediterranea TaxID=3076079 RepID=A0ABU3LC62_9FLAO|nr:tyrosinase family protein [Pricia sp. S334]MDT7830652.1 tyrosinase family protein [Pricia sp. S334]
MNVRKNVSEMSPTEKTAFVNAVLALKDDTDSPRPPAADAAGALNRYDVYVWVHSLVMDGAHKGPAFTPWHREFLRQFELELQSVSGDPTMTIPYWDSVEARIPSDAGYPFTTNLMGGMGTGTDNRVMTGQFAESAGWTLNVRTGASTGITRDNTSYLRRRTGQNPAQLPERAELNAALVHSDYDALNEEGSYAEGNANRANGSEIALSFRKILEYANHNGPHEWIGGNMMPSTSPNDPVFYLHHSNIDKVWAVWQQRTNGGVSNYLPTSGTADHSLNSVMSMLESSFFLFPVRNRPADVLNHKVDLGYMYDVDLPVLATTVTDLNFGTVEEGSTIQLPIPFTIESGRNMKFQINAFGGDAAFHAPTGAPAFEIVNHTDGVPQTHEVLIELETNTGTGSKIGLVEVNVYVWDDDRFYSNVVGDYLVDTFIVNLEAMVVEEVRSAIALVLDKSYSMRLNDGTSITRYEMLENAIMGVRDLLAPDDGVGMVYYDSDADPIFEITQKSEGGEAAINAALADPANQPGGNTAIGQGIIEGAQMLIDEINDSSTPYTNFGMLVMTDGNQNVHPYITEAPVSSAITGIGQDIYAIGLGQQGTTSEAALNDISRSVLLTGDMTGDERMFKLTNYFNQILADIKKEDVVLDPMGRLLFGTEHQVAYAISEADIRSNIVVLSPLAPFIKVSLIAPNGDEIIGTTGNVAHEINANNQIYRVTFPALPDKPETSHGGHWKVVLQLRSREEVKKICAKWQEREDIFKNRDEYNSVPYSVAIYTRSDLNFKCSVEKDSDTIGAEVRLFANLSQYRRPISGRVRAEVQWPNGKLKVLSLEEIETGEFYVHFKAEQSGIYQLIIKAEGRSMAGRPFFREAIRSVSIYKRNPERASDGGADNGAAICKTLQCLISQESIRNFLKKNEINPEELKKCLLETCGDDKDQQQLFSKSIKKKTMVEANENRTASSKDESSEKRDDCLERVEKAPELKKIEYPEPKIPEMSNMPMEMPAFKLNEKGEFEKVDFTFDESC